jgi:hypothetical protein
MVEWLVALGAALAPSAPIPYVATRYLAAIRDLWIKATLGIAAVALTLNGDAWLGCMALWFCIRWKSNEQLPSLVTWICIALTWFGLRALPNWAWSTLPWGWVAIACGQVAYMVWLQWKLPKDHPFFDRRTLLNVKRLKGGLGSPAITAISLALAVPFTPWWAMPILAAGLFITWSWLSFLGLAVALSWMYPAAALYLIVGVMALLAVWMATWFKRDWRLARIFELVPRGDSFDSVVNRLILAYLIARAWWTGPRLLGRGPYSLEPQLRIWATRCWIETPNGEAHVEWAQTLYEYGGVGLVAAGYLVGIVLVDGHLGDPYAASFLAAVVMSFAHWAPARHPAVALVVLACAAGALR